MNTSIYVALVTCAAYTYTCKENGNVVDMLIVHYLYIPPSIL